MLIGIFVPVLFAIIAGMLVEVFPNLFFELEDSSVALREEPWMIFVLLIAIPIKSLIQYIPTKIASGRANNKLPYAVAAVLSSAILFAVLGKDDVAAIIILFFTGIIWAVISYILCVRKSNAYLYVTYIHFVYYLLLVVGELCFIDKWN